jgi:transposase
VLPDATAKNVTRRRPSSSVGAFTRFLSILQKAKASENPCVADETFNRGVKEITTKEDELISWRRSTVAEYLAKGYSQTDIAKILKVSEPTISRDVEHLRQEASKAMSAYLEDLPLQHQKARWTVDLILCKSFEILDNSREISDKLNTLKLILQATQIRLSFLSDATVLNKALEQTQSIKQELDKLKNTEKTKPVYEVVTVEDNDGNKIRQARKLTKKKDSDNIIV